ncbi:Fc receptor-like protein 1 isoform X9 [Corvus moneduloides]|uniref:Fc receptor-like protein 1 isoform X9 n=1 Tax=Corvus moneduloides TaxID=1196302 RepID=UPI0013635959|nr:Fc receptor-like protein 1 isoform X9 [Corvus moneduloides]
MAGKVALLLWAQTLGLAGAQTNQLLVEPPWTPPVLWDRVTLTCQGLGTAGATTWYKDGQRWWQKGPDRFVVTESGTYQCHRPGTGLSPPVSVSNGAGAGAAGGGHGDTALPELAEQTGDLGVLLPRGETTAAVPRWDRAVPVPSAAAPQRPLPLQGLGVFRGVEGVGVSAGDSDGARAVPGAGAGGSPRAHRGVPPQSQLPQHPQPPAAPSPPPVPLLPARAVGGGPAGVPAAPAAHRGGLPLGELQLPGALRAGAVRKSSARLRVTVRRVPLSGVSVSAQPPGAQVILGDRLVLSCAVAGGTGPLSFSWHRGDSWELLGTGPHLELRHVGDNDSGHYQCRASNGHSVAKSVPLNVTVLVPVANATISPGALAQPVRAGDPVTLCCSVQVGSAPVTFTWLRNGREVARGPLLELGDVHVGHSGTYQCVATNQLGQDGHRVFRALSPELALTVTPRAHWDTAVAATVAGSLLFLVLLVGVTVGWYWWHRLASRKHQERAPPEPPEPLAPPEEGEVLYTHVTRTKQMQGPTRTAPPQDTQVTYAELPGPHGRPRAPSDIYGNVLGH